MDKIVKEVEIAGVKHSITLADDMVGQGLKKDENGVVSVSENIGGLPANVSFHSSALIAIGTPILGSVMDDNNVEILGGVKINQDVTIGEHVNIGENVSINNNTIILGSCSIGHNSLLGKNAKISDNVNIESNSIMLGSCAIGYNTIVGNDTSIQDGVTIGSHVEIDDGVIITYDGVNTTQINYTKLGSAVINNEVEIGKGTYTGDSVYIGTGSSSSSSNVYIGERVNIGDNVSIESDSNFNFYFKGSVANVCLGSCVISPNNTYSGSTHNVLIISVEDGNTVKFQYNNNSAVLELK